MAEQFGPYLLEEVIGRGGMGVVYRAFDSRRDRTVALKRLPREMAADENFQARFRRESRLAARLNEPHIIPIHDFGEIDGQLYLDMRLVEGKDLSKIIAAEGGRLAPDLAVDIIAQVAAALAAAHTAGLMHRDIKPSNVLVTGLTEEDRSTPFAYLVDFGIARAMGNEGTALTTTTDWFGTVSYMAPERISGSSGDSRADIYSLACLLYQCVVGHAPFTGEALQVLFAHVNAERPSAAENAANIPAGLDAVIRRGMAKDPDQRYQTASQFAAAARSSVGTGRAAAPTEVIRLATRPLPTEAPPATPASLPAPPPGPPPSRPASQPAPQSGPPPQPIIRTPAARAAAPPPSGPRPPAHPSTPPPRSPSRPPSTPGNRGNRKRALIATGVVAVLAVAAAVVGVLLARSDHHHASANPGSSGPTAPTGSGGGGSSGPSSSHSTGVGSWSDYANFSRLVGTGPGSTKTSFLGATCTLAGPSSTAPGMIDQVQCSKLTGTPVTFYVGRFSGGPATDAYIATLVKRNYIKKYWQIANQRRGLILTSPAGGTSADVTSSICAFPQFLVQFYAGPGSGLTSDQLRDRFWEKAVFPDTTPGACP